MNVDIDDTSDIDDDLPREGHCCACVPACDWVIDHGDDVFICASCAPCCIAYIVDHPNVLVT